MPGTATAHESPSPGWARSPPRGRPSPSSGTGTKRGRVAIRPVQHLPMDGYRTSVAGEVSRAAPAGGRGRLPRAACATGRSTFCSPPPRRRWPPRPSVRDNVPAERCGVVVGTCNAGLLGGENWYTARLAGEQADPRLVVSFAPGARRGAGRGIRRARAGAVCGHRLRGRGERDRLRRGPHPLGPGRRVPRRRHRRPLRRADRGLQLARVAVARAGCAVLEGPLGLSLGEGSGMHGAGAGGPGPYARPAGAGRADWATGCPPTATTRLRRTRRARAPPGPSRPRSAQRACVPEEVRYVNSHGTGTAKNDPAETKATKRRPRRAADTGRRCQQHQVDDRPPARAARARPRASSPSRRCRNSSRRRRRTSPSPTRNATWTTCPTCRGRCEIDVAHLQQLRLRRRERVAVVFTAGAGPEPPAAPALDRVVVTGLAALTPPARPGRLWDGYR